MEQINTKLKQNQIRCPYCRHIQDELLPYYEDLGYPKEHGINFYDVNKGNIDNNSFGIAGHQCQYQIINLFERKECRKSSHSSTNNSRN